MLKKIPVWATALAAIAGTSAFADRITVDGRTYEDVLVLETSSFYYVQIPDEGRTLSVPRDAVDEGSVVINDDPYYRDERKAKYDETKAARESGEAMVDDPAFHVQGQTTPNIDTDALLGRGGGGGGGGGGAGLGATRNDVETLLTGFGIAFQDGPGSDGLPTRVAKMPDGTAIELLGPANTLQGIRVKGRGTPQQYSMMLNQTRMMLAQLAPQAVGGLDGLINEAERNGRASATLNGVNVTLTREEAGEMLDFQLAVMAE